LLKICVGLKKFWVKKLQEIFSDFGLEGLETLFPDLQTAKVSYRKLFLAFQSNRDVRLKISRKLSSLSAKLVQFRYG
jgi:hypothetical protein